MTRETREWSEQIKLMQAEARAANQREDNPGDHRPDVYHEGDKTVYRASALGGCERALWYARTGVERSPVSATLMKAFREGSNSEDLVLQMARERYFFDITEPQCEYEIEVPGTDGLVVVRGHLDGLGASSGTKEVGNVEAKMLGPDLWKKSHTARFKSIPHWMVQVQLGMMGSGRTRCWMIWGEKDADGVAKDVSYTVVEYSARDAVMALAKVRRVEAAVAAGLDIECAKEEFGCSYWQLHEGKGWGAEDVETVDDQELGALGAAWLRAKDAVKMAEGARDKARDAFKRALAKNNIDHSVGVGARGMPAFVARKVEQTRVNVDRAKLEQDGLLDQYSSTSQSSYWTIEATKKTEQGES